MRQALRRAVRATGLRRAHIAAARMCCERALLATTYRARDGAAARSRILCYHSVGTPQWGVNDVSRARFRRQIEQALEAGYRFVPASQIAAGDAGDRALAITFDDGLRSVAANAAPVLREYGVPWTLFVVSDWAGGRHDFGDVLMTWREVEQAAAAGATIGSHSVTHPDFGRLPAEAAAHELAASREALRARLGIDVTEFAIPFGGSKHWTADATAAARAAGYATVYAQADERRAPGTVARTFVTRFDGDSIFRSLLAGAFDRWEEHL